MDLHDIVSMLSEIFTIVGLLVGVPLYIIGLSVRGFGGRWVEADGVVAATTSGPVIRWFDTTGEVHEARADSHETVHLEPGDDVTLWFNARAPERCRTHSPDHDGKAWRLTGLILTSLGLGSAVLGIVLLFV
ncbi:MULTISPECIES: DUF3592 domain-containing protein [unclassified Cryobacterium]|uniref:DUF3592 domain-containing protein n=1 Tax=unclassified Cryobacterium TaxID=2649013 RepID=UPI001F5443D2|nr:MULTISPECIES: DUF3592 domain-containing protein [unclassified Cryobacterium]